VTLTPTSPLSYLTTYTVKLSTAVADANGIALANPVSWTFTTTGTMVSKRINTGSTSAYSDSSGNTWLADESFKNGLVESIPGRTIANTGGYDQALFRDDRYGSSSTTLWSYNIPIPNGTYDVKLFFVELTKTGIGQRVFGVDVMNTAASPDIANLDIFKEVGANAVDAKTISDVVVTNSTIGLKSIYGTDLPEIAAIEIIPKHP
jgi:hypothetical protein